MNKTEKENKALVQIRKDLLEPSPSKRAERCKLCKRFQELGEIVSQYLTSKKIS